MRIIRILTVTVSLTGWAALAYFTYHNPPDAMNRLIALAVLFPTLTATLFFPAHVINSRPLLAENITGRSLRQSSLASLFITLCLWLRITRALNWFNALLILVIVVLTELVLSARTS